MKKVKCKKCGKKFLMGKTGTVDGCDECTGVERDKFGCHWMPGEHEKTYLPNNGAPAFKVKREEAMSKLV